jgi:hypothetical protein
VQLHSRLQGQLDPSDVLQEAYLEFSRSLKDYLRNPELPFFLWLRFITGRKLQALHRHHLYKATLFSTRSQLAVVFLSRQSIAFSTFPS